ncbi:hypothetical protein NP233_g7518 [Leucocoprinus birnbaumii]|uniref:KOW domain-containing protein n=1 Tax=Leucocoprinus birnbaumii TaxID=56174 RepID=A0AAD5VSD9_9AGAR|nr:hypothetical protein NP233_g7518 [Leucocoprinus birnbaumii]
MNDDNERNQGSKPDENMSYSTHDNSPTAQDNTPIGRSRPRSSSRTDAAQEYENNRASKRRKTGAELFLDLEAGEDGQEYEEDEDENPFPLNSDSEDEEDEDEGGHASLQLQQQLGGDARDPSSIFNKILQRWGVLSVDRRDSDREQSSQGEGHGDRESRAGSPEGSYVGGRSSRVDEDAEKDEEEEEEEEEDPGLVRVYCRLTEQEFVKRFGHKNGVFDLDGTEMRLWEVKAKVSTFISMLHWMFTHVLKSQDGLQMEALSTLTLRCKEGWPDDRIPVPLRIFWKKAFGNRIYIETETIESARAACKGVAYLLNSVNPNPKVMDPEDAYYIMNGSVRSQPRAQVGSWIRLAHGMYKRDIAYVFGSNESTNTLDVVLVPRINYEAVTRNFQNRQIARERRRKEKQDEARRPVDSGTRADSPPHPQAPAQSSRSQASVDPPRPRPPPPVRKRRVIPVQGLLDRTKLASAAVRSIPHKKRVDPDRWRIGVNTYDDSGFLVRRGLAPMQYATDLAMPTLEEVEWFTRCAVVPRENIKWHLRRIELASLQRGTRVRICGLYEWDYTGYIEEIHDDAFDIAEQLGSGVTTRVDGACVFRWFNKGDRVLVLAGPHKGRVAWVTAVDDSARTAVLYDHTNEEEFTLSFHFMAPAPDDRQFAPDTLSTSNEGERRLNVPEVPAMTIKEPIRMSKDSLFRFLQDAEVMVVRGDCEGQKGRVLDAQSASIISVRLKDFANTAVNVRVFHSSVLHFRLDPAGPYFKLGSDLVLRPIAAVPPAVVYQKLKGLDVLVIKGVFKGRWGKIHDVEETGITRVDFSAANTSSSNLPEIRAEDMLYRYFPGGAYMELDDKKELVPALYADKLIKDGFIDVDDKPDPNEPNYQLDVQRWVTGWESIEGRRMEREKQLWSARPTDKIPDGHFFTLLKDGALKEKPGWKVVFKVRTDIPELAGATYYEGYFVDIEKDIVILHDVNEDSPFPVIRQPFQALVPSPPQNIKEWVVVCDPDVARADGSAYFVREIGLEYSWVTTSSRKSTDRRRVKTKMMARMIAPPRNREKERNRR